MPNEHGAETKDTCPLEKLQPHCRWTSKPLLLCALKPRCFTNYVSWVQWSIHTTHLNKHFKLNTLKKIKFTKFSTYKLKGSIDQKIWVTIYNCIFKKLLQISMNQIQIIWFHRFQNTCLVLLLQKKYLQYIQLRNKCLNGSFNIHPQYSLQLPSIRNKY